MKTPIVLLLLYFLIFCTNVYAACTGASPTWTATPDYASVSSCVSQATTGDTINVLAGSATWTSTLSIDKGLSLIGAGSTQTIITMGGSGIIRYTPANPNANLLFRVSGFRFDVNQGSGQGIYLSSGNTLSYPTKVRIDHNEFINGQRTSTAGHYIYILNVRGVIDHNIFGAAMYPIRTPTSPINLGGNNSGHSEWNNYEGIVFGQTDNNIWFEDNDFTLADYGQGYAVTDCQEGQRYGYRYNTFHLTGGNGQLFDWHGNYGAQYSCMGVQIYGNNFLGGSGMGMMGRGGRFYVHNNNYTGSFSYKVYEESAASSNPVTYVGLNPPQYSQDINESYIFNNRTNYTGSYISTSIDGSCSLCRAGALNAGVDFFTMTSTPGVGCGTLTNRPSTCTTGQGFWATNQSCTDLTGMVGANPSTPISGTLYRCTATNTWTSLGSPPVYPHPLVSGAPAPTTHTVTPSAGPNGSISPNTPRTVNDGTTAQFTVSPNTGYSASVGGSCGGTLAGTTYTTAPIDSDCTVVATFTLITGGTKPSPPPAVWVQ